MIIIPTYLNTSRIHGHGCFTSIPIPAGVLVWVYDHHIDRDLGSFIGELTLWERIHAYGSNASGKMILPGDNAAWMNFSVSPNLAEGELMNGEFCLRACRNIKACEELTVSTGSDTDYNWKMQRCTKEEDSSLIGSLGKWEETATLPYGFSASADTLRKIARSLLRRARKETA